MISLRFHVTSPFSGEMNFSGVPLRAAFLNLLKEYNEQLSGNVHESDGLRAYSLDPFPCDSRFQTHFKEGDDYEFSVHLFKPSSFDDVLRKIALMSHDRLRIYHHYFPMRRIDFAQKSPSDLMTQWTKQLESIKSSVRLRFRFHTPTQLSHFGNDRAYLLPTPEKVLTGLLRIWNTVEGATRLEHTGEYYDWINEHVYVSGHDLHTVKVSLGRKRNLVGFTGDIVYTIESSKDPLAKFTIGLVKFAEICNIGKNRSAGFGKVTVKVIGGNNRNA